jgi:cell fate (sporulation/competence/biofilm development) regulator YlbF (YheA/YmcA/DUF963 family)
MPYKDFEGHRWRKTPLGQGRVYGTKSHKDRGEKMNIYDTMNQLERELRALPEYQAVVTALTAVKADEVASDLYAKFMTLQTKLQTGQLVEEAQQKEAQELFLEIQKNDLLADLLSKEQTLQIITSDLQEIVYKPLQELYGQ